MKLQALKEEILDTMREAETPEQEYARLGEAMFAPSMQCHRI